MGAYICKQPNGKFCRFSTVVDSITHSDMTREEYIEYCAEKAREEAIDVLDHYLQPFDRVKNDFRPDKKEDIEDFNLLLKSMGDKEGLSKERVEFLERWLYEMEND